MKFNQNITLRNTINTITVNMNMNGLQKYLKFILGSLLGFDPGMYLSIDFAIA